jgi:hypothetical protein
MKHLFWSLAIKRSVNRHTFKKNLSRWLRAIL